MLHRKISAVTSVHIHVGRATPVQTKGKNRLICLDFTVSLIIRIFHRRDSDRLNRDIVRYITTIYLLINKMANTMVATG